MRSSISRPSGSGELALFSTFSHACFIEAMTKGKGKTGGKKGGGKQVKQHGGHNSSRSKVDERRERQKLRKEERLAQWHDPKWKERV